MKKILIIRLSSIGDIVLTTPVVRCLKQQLPEAEIHYLTKKQYIPVLQSNPFIAKIHLFKDNFQELIPKLKAERFDHIVDLHKNFRSHYVRFRLSRPATSFPKLNLQKWLITKFHFDRLPPVHIVDRYFRAVQKLGIQNDGKGLDYFLLDPEQVNIAGRFPELAPEYVAIAIGAKHQTKIFPVHKVAALCNELALPVILLGGKEDMARGEEIRNQSTGRVVNGCGALPLNASASVINQATLVVSNDTGLMHIAAALKKPVISIWGNTIPAFGMYPYLPEEFRHLSTLIEVPVLSCRPCSKLGYDTCPKGHFDCMERIEMQKIVDAINRYLMPDTGCLMPD
ncbi:MAG: glycosyltransferase family 9 protein [Bacteroidetes bacterium]|nr:MAG: glycosyltransferase family 9 protein [Bacteroidota bacterium]